MPSRTYDVETKPKLRVLGSLRNIQYNRRGARIRCMKQRKTIGSWNVVLRAGSETMPRANVFGNTCTSTSGSWYVVSADDDTMSRVKVLHVRNLTRNFDENHLKEAFGVHGPVQLIKKFKFSAFLRFEKRVDAEQAMDSLNGSILNGMKLKVSLAHPTSDDDLMPHLLRQFVCVAGNGLAVESIVPPVLSGAPLGEEFEIGNGGDQGDLP